MSTPSDPEDNIRQKQLPPPPLSGGRERREERDVHTKHIDWAAMFPGEIILHGPTRLRRVALTFDDGPDAEWTPQILSVLRKYQVRATFMCVGERVITYPQITHRILFEGHVLGNHTFHHPNLTKISAAQVATELVTTNQALNKTVGVQPILFRPPYGALDRSVIEEIRTLNFRIIFWDVDSLDWSGLTAEQVETNVLSNIRPGAIVLMHSAGGRGESLLDTVSALPVIIETLQREHYGFVTIPELTGLPAYH